MVPLYSRTAAQLRGAQLGNALNSIGSALFEGVRPAPQGESDHPVRRNILAYKPLKGMERTTLVINALSDTGTDVTFIPRAAKKVYIDFGHQDSSKSRRGHPQGSSYRLHARKASAESRGSVF